MSAEVCTCPLRPNMTYDQIRSEIITPRKMCTDVVGKRWMCPTLLRELKASELKRSWQKRQAKQMKKEGYTPDQIASKSRGVRRQAYDPSCIASLDLSDL